ncbi:MAG: hypothetical protein JNM17_24985 [Archangium sp.]|nr:hypothetical protein [Archangium sp.]
MKTKELKAFKPSPGAAKELRDSRDELERAQHDKRRLEIENEKLKERLAQLEQRLDVAERERERLSQVLIKEATNAKGQSSAFDKRHVADLIEFLKRK